jgi:4-hydroxy-3-methylbut-2-enyl diphosphate reductase
LGFIEMKISIAKSSGFCMGVRRAVEMVLDASTEHLAPICTYGPLIHNPQVLKHLAEKGIRILNEMPDSGAGIVLIRAHGVPPDTKAKLKNAGFDVLDATCPRVIKIQTIIKKHAAQGYASIIIGDKNHPEVVGLRTSTCFKPSKDGRVATIPITRFSILFVIQQKEDRQR